MWNSRQVLSALGTTAALFAFSQMANAKTIVVPKGTEVKLVFVHTLSSKTAKVGQIVPFHVAVPMKSDGQVILKKGTFVKGIISSVEHRKRFGISARIKITLNPVRSLYGTMIPLEPQTKGKYAGSRSDKAAYASGGAALLLGPIGLVGGYFVVGKQVNVKAGTPFISEVSQKVVLH
jgi:hypothetical protein